MSDQLFAIGDIHGCANELILLLSKLPLTKESTLIFLGDYIDRGPYSSKVIETVLELFNYCKVVPLMGNHEQLLLNFMKENANDEDVINFIYNGGNFTLNSYANDKGEYEIPFTHQRFFTSLKMYYMTEQYFFVHAGVPNIPLNSLSKEHQKDMLWLRSSFFESKFKWDRLIVHGHTPVKAVDIKENRINIDTGLVYENKLSAISFPSRTIYEVHRDSVKEKERLATGRRTIRHAGSLTISISINNQEVMFQSINFSELGLLLQRNPKCPLIPGNPISGKIINPNGKELPFTGTIIREDSDKNIAIKFDKPVLDSE